MDFTSLVTLSSFNFFQKAIWMASLLMLSSSLDNKINLKGEFLFIEWSWLSVMFVTQNLELNNKDDA